MLQNTIGHTIVKICSMITYADVAQITTRKYDNIPSMKYYHIFYINHDNTGFRQIKAFKRHSAQKLLPPTGCRIKAPNKTIPPLHQSKKIIKLFAKMTNKTRGKTMGEMVPRGA